MTMNEYRSKQISQSNEINNRIQNNLEQNEALIWFEFDPFDKQYKHKIAIIQQKQLKSNKYR